MSLGSNEWLVMLKDEWDFDQKEGPRGVFSTSCSSANFISSSPTLHKAVTQKTCRDGKGSVPPPKKYTNQVVV